MIGCWITWSLFRCEKHAFVNFSVITRWWEGSCLIITALLVIWVINPAAAEWNITEWGFSTSVQWVLMSQNSGTVTGAVFTKKVFSVIHYTHLAAWRLNWTINLCLKTPDEHQNSEIKTGEQAASSSTAFTHRERDALTLTELGSLKFLVCPINTGYSNHVADALRPPSPVPNS